MSNDYHLAQVNIARLHHPLDDERTAEFVAGIDPINALAEAGPGFVWRLKGEDGQSSSYVTVTDDPLLIVNLSVWETPEHLRQFVFKTDHSGFLRRRRQWFRPSEGAINACWWIPAGQYPTAEEALKRLAELDINGPTDDTFPFRPPFPQPPS